MRIAFAIALLALLVSVAKADLVRIGTIPSPDLTTSLSGLAIADENLFAVASFSDSTVLYLIDRHTGEVLRRRTVIDVSFICTPNPLNFLSCAFEPFGEGKGSALDSGFFWVGNWCGEIIKYRWRPDTLELVDWLYPLVYVSSGMSFQGGYLYVLDSEVNQVVKIDPVSGHVIDYIYLERSLPYLYCLEKVGEYFYAAGSSNALLFKLNGNGEVETIYGLEEIGTSPINGLAIHNDTIYVAINDTLIHIYSFNEHRAELPEGDNIEIEIVPDQVEVGFDSVTVAGELFASVLNMQPCPPPAGVTFISDFYEMTTTANFDHTTEVTLMTTDPLPPDVKPGGVRVFVRPSGECQEWRDATVKGYKEALPEYPGILRSLSRTQSEDDEFSLFVLGVDRRRTGDVIDSKFGDLRTILSRYEQEIPPEVYEEMALCLTRAMDAFGRKAIASSIALIDSIAIKAKETSGIPHTYCPTDTIPNVAGKIISRAHTLVFSLSKLMSPVSISENPMVSLTERFAGSEASNLILLSNPSGRDVTIRMKANSLEPLHLSIYSVEGRLVRQLLKNQMIEDGAHILWDGCDDHGSRVTPGVYFVVAIQGRKTSTAKIILAP